MNSWPRRTKNVFLSREVGGTAVLPNICTMEYNHCIALNVHRDPQPDPIEM